ncbi:OmpA family protein [Chitinimonas koreensis]|uniref:OmpA family protein n=1 Tax=Chitinimonas koreensis TaxID=356302 RepID=UPI0003FDBAE8|nr:OmpA family protein [Chitinimonas koreensis]QNM98169.1 OmpA family protein [Chitinimonas koreensis]
MQKMKRTLVQSAVCAVLGVAALSAYADKDGYAIDSRSAVVKSGFGLCWRTSSWSKDKAIAECDPDLVPKQVVAAAVEPPKPEVQAPKPVPLAVPKKLETLTLNAAALFEFNKAVLKEEGKQALDAVAGVLLERKYEPSKTKIEVEGHTDRIGKADYNKKLSEERAASAREYLVTKGIPAEMITSKGLGFDEPVTKPEDCKKVLKNRKKLIECYAPDRRVEVEIYATVEQ